jgi:cytochrome c553
MNGDFRLPIFFTFLWLVAASPSPDGRRIVEQGNANGAPPCASCHGPTLDGNPAIHAPAIAGLPAAMVLARLEHYASPQGHNASMKQVASALSTSERKAIATFLAGLPRASAESQASKVRSP